MTVRILAVMAVVGAAGCGEPDFRPKACDFEALGVCIANPSGDDSLTDPEAPARMEVALHAALAYWGADESAIAGWAISFEPDLICDGEAVAGCTWFGHRTIQLRTWGPGCFESTAIIHEAGHAVLGTDAHDDPRFWCSDGAWRFDEQIALMRSPTASPGCRNDYPVYPACR
jgi:hypothetical protein